MPAALQSDTLRACKAALVAPLHRTCSVKFSIFYIKATFYRNNLLVGMRQISIQSLAVGLCIGGLMCMTNMYFGTSSVYVFDIFVSVAKFVDLGKQGS